MREYEKLWPRSGRGRSRRRLEPGDCRNDLAADQRADGSSGSMCDGEDERDDRAHRDLDADPDERDAGKPARRAQAHGDTLEHLDRDKGSGLERGHAQRGIPPSRRCRSGETASD
jgi:hypothetical protein